MSIPFDQEFIDMMVPHHETAVEMAKVAQERAQHRELRDFAGSVVAAQSSELVRMREWRQSWFGEDSGPANQSEAGMADMEMGRGMMSGSNDMKDMVGGLRSADPFDKAFIEAMLPHHESAIRMAKRAQERAQHPELKGLADAIVSTQSRDISRMRAWLDAWD